MFPPEQCTRYAGRHDQVLWHTLLVLPGCLASSAPPCAQQHAQLPCRLGGCRLRSAAHIVPAAYWAAWADVLPSLRERFPDRAANLELSGEASRPCLQDALAARHLLRGEGFDAPTFPTVAKGARPEQPDPYLLDPGEWRHGWHYYPSTTREQHARQHIVTPRMRPASRALLRSASGRHCARHLTAVSREKVRTMSPDRFRVTFCRRLRLPFFLPEAVCEECGMPLGEYGDYPLLRLHAYRARASRVQAKAKHIEPAWEQVLKEAGATTHFQKLLRQTTPPVDPSDDRWMDVIASGLPLFGGRTLLRRHHPLAPACQWLPIRLRCGHGRRSSGEGGGGQGAHISRPREQPSGRAPHTRRRIGGRWDDADIDLVRQLAAFKVQVAPLWLRCSVELSWTHRWWSVLGIAVQDSMAASILAPAGKGLVIGGTAGYEPALDEVLDAQRWE